MTDLRAQLIDKLADTMDRDNATVLVKAVILEAVSDKRLELQRDLQDALELVTTLRRATHLHGWEREPYLKQIAGLLDHAKVLVG